MSSEGAVDKLLVSWCYFNLSEWHGFYQDISIAVYSYEPV